MNIVFVTFISGGRVAAAVQHDVKPLDIFKKTQ